MMGLAMELNANEVMVPPPIVYQVYYIGNSATNSVNGDNKDSNPAGTCCTTTSNAGPTPMVIEQKFADYGSIHSATDVSLIQINNNAANLLGTHRTALSAPSSYITDCEPLSPTCSEPTTNMAHVSYFGSQSDKYQTQPLLPSRGSPRNPYSQLHQNDKQLTHVGKNDKWKQHNSHNGTLHDRKTQGKVSSNCYLAESNTNVANGRICNRSDEDDIDDDDDSTEIKELRSYHLSSDVIKIDMPSPMRSDLHLPQERWKTLIAGGVLIFSSVMSLLSLSLVHDRVPDRNKYPPLSDVILDNVAAVDWALNVSEYIIIICINSCITALFFHKYRFIVFRRLFLIISILYLYRAITIYVTVLPLSSTTYPCSPKLEHPSALVILRRVLRLMSGFGLSINGQHVYCGDFIYSGHTVTLVLSYLFIKEYTPEKLYPLHWLYGTLSTTGVIMLQLSHGHYTIDVIIAYFITTRVFYTYHTLANHEILKNKSANNFFSRSWWFRPFLYFERNIRRPVPRKFEWPLPWPRMYRSNGTNTV